MRKGRLAFLIFIALAFFINLTAALGFEDDLVTYDYESSFSEPMTPIADPVIRGPDIAPMPQSDSGIWGSIKEWWDRPFFSSGTLSGMIYNRDTGTVGGGYIYDPRGASLINNPITRNLAFTETSWTRNTLVPAVEHYTFDRNHTGFSMANFFLGASEQAKDTWYKANPDKQLPYFARTPGASDLGLSVLPWAQGRDEGFTVTGWLTNDILHPNADVPKITELRGKYLSRDAYKQYRNDNPEAKITYSDFKAEQLHREDVQKEFRDAGAVSIFAGRGNGEVSVADKLPASSEIVDYYPGDMLMPLNNDKFSLENINKLSIVEIIDANEAADALPYRMPMQGVFVEMAKNRENATPVNVLNNTMVMQENNREGTIVQVAPDVYLTAGHVADRLWAGDPVTINDKPHKVDKVASAYSGELENREGDKSYQVLPNYADLGKFVITEIENAPVKPNKDIAVFTVADPSEAGKIKAGESIPIMPIADALPQKDDRLFFYGRPITHSSIDNTDVYHAEAKERSVAGPEKADLSFYTDGIAVQGWSGSGVYSKSKIGDEPAYELEGILSKGTFLETAEGNISIEGVSPVFLGARPMREVISKLSNDYKVALPQKPNTMYKLEKK